MEEIPEIPTAAIMNNRKQLVINITVCIFIAVVLTAVIFNTFYNKPFSYECSVNNESVAEFHFHNEFMCDHIIEIWNNTASGNCSAVCYEK